MHEGSWDIVPMASVCSIDGWVKEEPWRSALPAKKTADSDELEVMTKQEGLMRNGDISHLFTVNALYARAMRL